VDKWETLLKKWGKSKSNGGVKYYSSRKYYTKEDGCVRIWNKGTPSFKRMEKRFDKLRFEELHDLVEDEDVSVRGNQQIAYGFAHQNQNGRDEVSHLNKPQIRKGTTDKSVLKAMVILGSLGKSNNLLPSIVTKSNIRNCEYTKFLHPKNVFEGLLSELPTLIKY
jgi:hypothetical protein